MAAIFAFKCSCCGEIHEGSPSFGYNEPWQYSTLSDEQKEAMGRLTDDLCTITHDEGTDYFIRAVLEIPIMGVEDPFSWGVWSSLSEKSFNRYVETFDNPTAGETFFGWVCNQIPCYPGTGMEEPFSADVVVQAGRARPKLRLISREELAQHPLIVDQREGISIAQAQEMAEELMHGVADAADSSGGKNE